MIDTLRLTAEGAKKLLDAKEISGGELFAAYLAAIGERDPELHAYLHVCDDPASRAATGEGIPIAIKDVIGTKGICRMSHDFQNATIECHGVHTTLRQSQANWRA